MSKDDVRKRATKKDKNNGDASRGPTKKNATPTKQKAHKVKYVAIGVGAGILIILLLIFIIGGNSTMTAAKLIKQYAKNADYVTDIIEKDDPDGLMGDENQYTSKSSWNDSRLKDIIEPHAGTVEVFRNEEDAKLREWYINEVNASCERHVAVEKYGPEVHDGACNTTGYGTLYRNKTVLLRLSRSYSQEQVAEYERAFDELIQKFDVAESNIPSQEKIEQIKQQKETEIESTHAEAEEKLKSNLDAKADDFEKTVNDAAADINKADTAKLREDMEQFRSVPYLADRVANWEKQINDIDAAKEAAKAAYQKRILTYDKFTNVIKEGMSLDQVRDIYGDFDSQCKVSAQSGNYAIYSCSSSSSYDFWAASFTFYNGILNSKSQTGLD